MASVLSEETLSMEQLEGWVSSWASQLSSPHLILLNGPLGAGKTALTQALVKVLGGEGVSSPTYSLIQPYKMTNGELFHVDLYRITDLDDLESVGFWDLFEDDRHIVVVEWAERVPEELWPLHWSRSEVTIEKLEEDSRRSYQLKQ